MAQDLLEKIRNGEIEFWEAEEGIVSNTYITENFVLQEPEENDEKIKKNRFLIEKLYKNGVAVPEVLEYSEDPLFIVFERLEGISLDKKDAFSDLNYLEAARNAGEALAEIHEQEGIGYGKPDIEEGFEHGEFDNWKDFVKDYIQGTLHYVQSDGFRPVVEKADEVIELEELPDDPESRVLHMDYTLDNVIVAGDMSVSVIDFDGAHYGDPAFDLMYAELIMSKKGEKIVNKFMEGYREVRDPELTPELERNYKALAVMRDARGGEWCLRNEKDVDLEDWRKGLEDTVENLI